MRRLVGALLATCLVAGASNAPAAEYPDGRVETGSLPQDAATIRRAFAVRVADVRFVLDRLERWQRRGPFAGRLDLGRVGMVGHSLGGATAAGTMLVNRRLRAGSCSTARSPAGSSGAACPGRS
jgi:hypothetical protein